jgi:DNA-directed RNA polymerase subunit RPC12/RpoP
MAEAKSFECPKCGSALTASGIEKEIKCAFCGSTVIVPEELRGQSSDQDQVDPVDLELLESLDPYPRGLNLQQRLQWLVQNGVEVTAKVKFVDDKGVTKNGNPFVTLELDVRPKGIKPYFAAVMINVPRSSIPRAGDKVQIKYNPNDHYDVAIQIDGQFHQD